jgi:hypothetical protein
VGIEALRINPRTKSKTDLCAKRCENAVHHCVGDHTNCEPDVCQAMRVFQRLVEVNAARSDAAEDTADDDEVTDTDVPDGMTESEEARLKAELWIEAWKVIEDTKRRSHGTPAVSVHAANHSNVTTRKIVAIVQKYLDADTVYLLARSISSQIVECLWSILIQFSQGKRICYYTKNLIGDFTRLSVTIVYLGWPETLARVLKALQLPDFAASKFVREQRVEERHTISGAKAKRLCEAQAI